MANALGSGDRQKRRPSAAPGHATDRPRGDGQAPIGITTGSAARVCRVSITDDHETVAARTRPMQVVR